MQSGNICRTAKTVTSRTPATPSYEPQAFSASSRQTKEKVNISGKRKEALKREEKAQSQLEKEKIKHDERVSAIAIEEEDDDDVKFFYSLKGEHTNRVFNDN